MKYKTLSSVVTAVASRPQCCSTRLSYQSYFDQARALVDVDQFASGSFTAYSVAMSTFRVPPT